MRHDSIASNMKRIGLIMAILIPALTSLDIYHSIVRIKHANKVDEATVAIRPFLQAAGNWALERGASRTAIFDEGAVFENLAKVIATQRAEGDAAFKEAMRVLENGPDFHEKERRIKEVKARHREVQALRKALDANFNKPLSDRDSSLGSQVVPLFSRLIETSQALRRFYWNEMPVDGQGRLYAEVLDSAWVMAEFAGRERAMLGSLVSSGAVMSPELGVTLAKFRTRVDMGYGIIDLEYAEMPPEVQSSIRSMRTSFLGRFQKIRNDVYAASGDASYSLTPERWIDEATRGIDAIIALQMTTIDAIHAHANHAISRAYMGLGFDFLLVTLGFLVLAYVRRYFNYKVLVPIYRITKAMKRVSEGDLERQIPYMDAENEIGTMAVALDGFRETIRERNHLEELEKQREIEARKERTRQREERHNQILALAKRFEDSVGKVSTTIMTASHKLEARARDMFEHVQQSKNESGSIVTASVQSSSNINAVAAAVEQFAATVEEINLEIGEASDIAGKASEQVDRAFDMIRSLDTMTEAVSAILDLIRNITNQTNLLSLNANIEAANAGDAGKGFEIVAREIQGLAKETAASTDKISEQIEEIQNATREVVQVMDFMHQTIERLNRTTFSVSSAVEEQSATTREISQNLNEAAGGNVQVSSSVETVDKSLQETFEAINDMLSSSKEYGKLADELNQEVTEFLTFVKA